MTTNPPGQPDGIEDDSYDLPDPVRAAERVRDYIRATGDGLYDTVDGAPLYARDLEAICCAVLTLAGLTQAELLTPPAPPHVDEPHFDRPVVDIPLPA